MTGPTIVAAQPTVLSSDELQIVRLYRVMDLSEKSHYQDAMKWSAEKYPQTSAPKLRLVGGGES